MMRWSNPTYDSTRHDLYIKGKWVGYVRKSGLYFHAWLFSVGSQAPYSGRFVNLELAKQGLENQALVNML